MSSKSPVDPELQVAKSATHTVVEKGSGEGMVETAAPPLSERPIFVPPSVAATADVKTVPSRTPWQILWIKLRKNRAAMVALYVLGILYGVMLLAGFFAPYTYEKQNLERSFHPPMLTRVRLRDAEGNWHRPFVHGIRPVSGRSQEYEEDTSQRYPIRFFNRGDQYHLLWVIPTNIHLFGVDEPGRLFLFGTDIFGRDTFSRLLYGARISLSVGIIGIMLSTSIGMLVGGVSGYFGGAIDFTLMRVVELILALPSLYVILVLRQTFAEGLTSTETYLLIVLILSFIGWAAQARVIRGMVLSLKEQEYVVAAQALGFSRMWIVLKHILPNTLSFVIVTATLSVPFFILSEVTLSFLGVGIQEPEASWGNMLSAGLNVRYLTDFWWILVPGVFIFIAVMAWNVFGDGLRDAADPRTQR
jgi:peptide/nickel transport system permease protein